jgi:hypothetical protein
METNQESVSKPRKQICAALVKAQKGFGPALKSSQNPHFKSRYADLSACVEAVVEALNNNGIALTQHTHHAEHGVCVETILIHESGEELSFGKLFVPCTKNDAQGYGSAITYARRYQLQTALGIAPEDDDGNAASSSAPRIISKDLAKGTTTYAARPKPTPRTTDEFPVERPSKAKPVEADDDRIPF